MRSDSTNAVKWALPCLPARPRAGWTEWLHPLQSGVLRLKRPSGAPSCSGRALSGRRSSSMRLSPEPSLAFAGWPLQFPDGRHHRTIWISPSLPSATMTRSWTSSSRRPVAVLPCSHEEDCRTHRCAAGQTAVTCEPAGKVTKPTLTVTFFGAVTLPVSLYKDFDRARDLEPRSPPRLQQTVLFLDLMQAATSTITVRLSSPFSGSFIDAPLRFDRDPRLECGGRLSIFSRKGLSSSHFPHEWPNA
jgi:hypothetical protein